jgi:Cys-tRNA(Pro) deacylase
MQLQRYCAEHGIDAEFIETEASTKSAEEAANVLQVQPHQIIKSLVFYIDERPVVTVVRGPDRVSEDRLATECGASACRMASPDEVKTATGYAVGGVPPVGIEVPKVIDEAVLAYDTVYGGAGSEHRMIGLDPRFIVGENDHVGDVVE